MVNIILSFFKDLVRQEWETDHRILLISLGK